MDNSQYDSIQEQVILLGEQLQHSRDQKNLNSDLDQAKSIAALERVGDIKELIKVCKQQGIDQEEYIHIVNDFDAQSEQTDTTGSRQKHIVATELATLLFRELLLPPANHAPHAEVLATTLQSLYPDLTSDVLNATEVADKPADVSKKNDLFFAPPNSKFRSYSYYKPLSRRKKEIRLVSLWAGKRNQDVQCTLMDPISLAAIQSELLDPQLPGGKKPHPYTALSYSAGDLTKTVKIHVNDVEFEVFESLERALRRIRHRQYAVHVWIDQICIDQHEPVEKAWQVSIMRDIYALAKKTLVFLDIRDHQASSVGFKKFFMMIYNRATSNVANMPQISSEIMSPFDRLNKEFDPRNADQYQSFRPILSQQRSTAQWLASILLRAEYLPSLKFLIAMYNAPWWRRSWVYQELIVSRDAKLLCGDEEINWTAFQVFNRLINEAAKLLHQSPRDPNMFVLGSKTQYGLASVIVKGLTDNQPAIAQLGHLRETFLMSGECDIRWLLSVWRDLKATDSRDKIYAAIGVAKSRYRIVPEYTDDSTLTQLLVEVVKRSVLVDGRLDIILDGGESDRHNNLNLPSWVPNFTAPSSKKFPPHMPQYLDPRFDNSTSQAGPSRHAEYAFRAMKDLPAGFQFISNHVSSSNNSLPPLLRIELVRRWSLRTHELGIVGNLPRSQSVHDSWASLAFTKPKAYATAVNNRPENAPYPHTDDYGDLISAYLQSVHFYPDIEQVISAMDYEEKYSDPMSMAQLQLGVRQDAERVLAKGREAQRSGNWRFFCTDDLAMGMLPADTRAGDWICFAGGISVPFVISPCDSRGLHREDDEKSRTEASPKLSRCTVVGAAYVHGYMFGRAAELLSCRTVKTEWVDLY